MQLNQLRTLSPYSMQSGRPEYDLTDSKWQEELQIRKLYILPNRKPHSRMGGKYSKGVNKWEKNEDYLGETNWQRYCSFINDVLKNIRAGNIDYVYFKYQIMDLLKFHYDNLCTEYINGEGYWKVWLES